MGEEISKLTQSRNPAPRKLTEAEVEAKGMDSHSGPCGTAGHYKPNHIWCRACRICNPR